MGASASIATDAAGGSASAAAIKKELITELVTNFAAAGPVFEKLPLDDLCSARLALGRISDTLDDVMKRKFDAKAEMPEPARALCDGSYEDNEDQHKSLIQATVPYVIDLARYAHVSKRLKANLRQLLGLDTAFTTNLDWADAWEGLHSGCSDHMRALGDKLDALFLAQGLRERLGTYDPPVGTTTTKKATATAGPSSSPKMSLSLSSPHAAAAVQFIPAQCSSDQFGADDDVVRHNDLECAYIHFLRLLALALDDGFQEAVNSTLKASGVCLVGGGVVSGGIKGYARMYNKMQSKDDHRSRQKPRPAHNIDVVRCLATFETVEDMRKGFECIQGVFVDGKYAKFKNGMAWDDAFAANRFHLRVVLATGRFTLPSRRTMGELRQDPRVQALWGDYLRSEQVPPSVARGTWRRQAEQALAWIRFDVPDSTPVSMLCEVQMLLRDYAEVRTAMHEPYKIVRATDPVSLHKDFAKYQLAREIRAEFDHNGDSELNVACRDGLAVALPRQLVHVGPEDMVRALRIACQYVQPECVKVLLLEGGEMAADHLNEALHAAAAGTPGRDGFDLGGARADVVRTLLGAKADPDKRADNEATATYMAAQNGHVDALQVLLGAKADPDKRADDGATPVYVAAQEGHVDALQVLLGAKADPDKARNDGATPLFTAAENRHADALQLLLRAKADPDKRTDEGAAPLYTAAENGHADVLQLLLGAKADPHKAEDDGTTPVYMAAQNGHADVLQLLLRAKAVLDKDGTNDWAAPLYMAAECGHAGVLELLLAAKADPSKAAEDGTTPLYMAAQNGHTDVMQLLLAGKAVLDKADDDGTTPMQMAAQNGHIDAMKLLLAAKANPDKATDNGVTAMYLAAECGHAGALELLLAAKADPEKAEDDGTTPTFMAAQNSHTGALRVLLGAKADPDKAQDDGTTPTSAAAEEGHVEALELLIVANADPDQAQDDGTTPTFVAAQNGHADALQVLLGAKADPDQAKDDGATPMCVAAENGHADALQLLLGAKADASKGLSASPPLRIAELHKHHECVALLQANST